MGILDELDDRFCCDTVISFCFSQNYGSQAVKFHQVSPSLDHFQDRFVHSLHRRLLQYRRSSSPILLFAVFQQPSIDIFSIKAFPFSSLGLEMLYCSFFLAEAAPFLRNSKYF